MKTLLTMAAVLAALAVVPAAADDGRVPQATLRALGLGGMQVVSDREGMQVRGQAAFVSVRGSALVFGQLMTPDTLNFTTGSAAFAVDSNGDTTGTGIITADSPAFAANLALSLNVTFPDTSTFAGTIFGITGGLGAVSVNLP
jgi:hypothetical protein